MQNAVQSRWEEYVKMRTPALRQELALQYLNLVRYVVAKQGPAPAGSGVVLDGKDLVQVGVIGLLDAIERFDPSRGVKFETYAIARIRGTIQDELRKLDWVPRSVRKKARAMRETEGESNASHPGRQHPDVSLFAEEAMGIMMNAAAGDIHSIENLSTEGTPDVLDEMGMEQMKGLLMTSVEKLPPDDRLIITLYYYEELTFKEIGTILHLSESRVSQKHAAVMKKLKAELGEA
jgi:RNA polymerase sigma factor FliA